MSSHAKHAENIQNALIRNMTPARRLSIAMDLYRTAWEIKKSGLRHLHPDWTEEAIEARTRRIFQTGYAGN